jgi:hypothetical protein
MPAKQGLVGAERQGCGDFACTIDGSTYCLPKLVPTPCALFPHQKNFEAVEVKHYAMVFYFSRHLEILT